MFSWAVFFLYTIYMKMSAAETICKWGLAFIHSQSKGHAVWPSASTSLYVEALPSYAFPTAMIQLIAV